jgi:hypothetical protein
MVAVAVHAVGHDVRLELKRQRGMNPILLVAIGKVQHVELVERPPFRRLDACPLHLIAGDGEIGHGLVEAAVTAERLGRSDWRCGRRRAGRDRRRRCQEAIAHIVSGIIVALDQQGLALRATEGVAFGGHDVLDRRAHRAPAHQVLALDAHDIVKIKGVVAGAGKRAHGGMTFRNWPFWLSKGYAGGEAEPPEGGYDEAHAGVANHRCGVGGGRGGGARAKHAAGVTGTAGGDRA